MTTALATPAPLVRRQVLPTAVLGMLIFVAVEAMFFAGLMSAYTISRSITPPGLWPPPGTPLLPTQAAGGLTVLLLLSGASLAWAHARHQKNPRAAFAPLLGAATLGLVFFLAQVQSTVALLDAGFTPAKGAYGGFFTLIVGSHALHVLAGAAWLARSALALKAGRLTADAFFGTQTFWYFVVGVWPLIFARVYF